MTTPHLYYDDIYDINSALTQLNNEHPELKEHIDAIRAIIPHNDLETITNILDPEDIQAHDLSLCEAIYIPTSTPALIISTKPSEDNPRIYIYPYTDNTSTHSRPFYASPDSLHLTSTRYHLPLCVRKDLKSTSLLSLRSAAATAYHRADLQALLNDFANAVDDAAINEDLRQNIYHIIETLDDSEDTGYKTMADLDKDTLFTRDSDSPQHWTYFMYIAYLNGEYPLVLIDYDDNGNILAFDPLNHTLNHYYPYELHLTSDTATAIEFNLP